MMQPTVYGIFLRSAFINRREKNQGYLITEKKINENLAPKALDAPEHFTWTDYYYSIMFSDVFRNVSASVSDSK